MTPRPANGGLGMRAGKASGQEGFASIQYFLLVVLRAASRDVAWSTLPHRPATQRWTAIETQHLFHRMLEVLPIGLIVFPGTGVQGNLADKARRLGIPVWRFNKDGAT
jgi:hypothetical protein